MGMNLNISLKKAPGLAIIIMLIPMNSFSQADKKFIRQGNREYEKR